jgi:hypothetical protein
MKSTTIFGIVIMAITVTMTMTPSAPASEIYSGSTTLVKGTNIVSSLSGTSTLSTTGGTVLDTCTGGTVSGATANAGGATETVRGTIAASGLTWSGCTKTTDTLEGCELEIHWISGTINGTVTGKGCKVTVEMVAEFGGTCSYTLGSSMRHLGTLAGSLKGDATLAANTVVNGAVGNSFLCPADTKWVASYTVTSPTPVHVTES